MPSRVLVTSFGPFGDTAINPSREAVARLEQRWSLTADLMTAQLPVSFRRSSTELDELLRSFEPDIVIATGLAAARKAITVERLAVNLADARISDIDGYQPAGVELAAGASAAIWSNLPIKRIVEAIGESGIPARASMSAGTYVCNSVFHRLCRWANEHGKRAGFIHVPSAAILAPAAAARALEIAVGTCLEHVTAADIAMGEVA